MAIQQQLDVDMQRARDAMEALLGKGRSKKSMKIKKIGHCCLVIETKGIRIMTDPGVFTTAQDDEKNISVVLITHEHADHFHIESLKKVLANNPQALVVTNSAVAKLLEQENIAHSLLEHGGSVTLYDVLFEGIGEHHATIYQELGQVQNTGFFIDSTLFYPGDAFTDPRLNGAVGQAQRPIPILALPVAGPWMKISEAIDYAVLLKPTQAFPVHDGILKSPTMMQGMLATILKNEGIDFVPLAEGEEKDFS
jgi:L-ascorbate metabolism protein UlaG (beta-lactamase superfamily)